MHEQEMLQIWGKTADKTGARSPLLFHMLDVSYVFRQLYRFCLSEDFKQSVVSSLKCSPAAAELLIIYICGLHDIGKATPRFQAIIPAAREMLEKAGFVFLESDIRDHGLFSVFIIEQLLSKPDSPATMPPMLATLCSLASGAHHGTFHDIGKYEGMIGPQRLGDGKWTDARDAIAVELWRALTERDATTRIDLVDDATLSPAALATLSGLISVADWIGSNEKYFKIATIDVPLEEYQEISAKRAEHALRELGWLPRLSPARHKPFDKMFPFEPNDLQETVIEAVADPSGPFLLVVEAPMGIGKTEAALYAFDRAITAGVATGAYIALPTQATSNAMYKRVIDYLAERGHQFSIKAQLVHGNALLARAERMHEVYGDKEGGGRVEAQSWFTPKKRALLTPFGIGTIDQCLLSALSSRHWFVRLFGLAGKVVVFDEVHAYDTYMSTILERLLHWLASLRCTVVLLSATLPARRREALVKAFTGEWDGSCGTAAYPRVTRASAEGATVRSVDLKPDRLIVRCEHREDSIESILSCLHEGLQGGGCAAVVCNTVDRAQKIYEAVRDAAIVPPDDCLLLHARLPYLWRQEREATLLRRFGKPDKGTKRTAGRPGKGIVVATQVIEQSLDLDFDLMLSEMAPIDLLLQRMGRLWRHEEREDRAPAVITTRFILLRPADAQPGRPAVFPNSSVYDEYILLRSWLVFPFGRDIALPGDIDDLVQWSYSPGEPEDLDDEWKSLLRGKRRRNEIQAERDASLAKKRIIPRPDIFCEKIMFGSSLSYFESDDPDVHPSVLAATRLGEPAVRTVCLHEKDGKFEALDGAPVDLNRPPDTSETLSLLRSIVPIGNKYLRPKLIHSAEHSTASWSRSPHLRYCRLLVFRDGRAAVGGMSVRLDQELGLEFEKSAEE